MRSGNIKPIISYCRNRVCRKQMHFYPNESVNLQLYCCKECHIEEYRRTGLGLKVQGMHVKAREITDAEFTRRYAHIQDMEVRL